MPNAQKNEHFTNVMILSVENNFFMVNLLFLTCDVFHRLTYCCNIVLFCASELGPIEGNRSKNVVTKTRHSCPY